MQDFLGQHPVLGKVLERSLFGRFEPSLEDCWFCWIPRIAEVSAGHKIRPRRRLQRRLRSACAALAQQGVAWGCLNNGKQI